MPPGPIEPDREEGFGADEEGVGPLAREHCKRDVDLPAGARSSQRSR
jgi:hypothetical protein